MLAAAALCAAGCRKTTASSGGSRGIPTVEMDEGFVWMQHNYLSVLLNGGGRELAWADCAGKNFSGFRVPTSEEWGRLISLCDWEYVTTIKPFFRGKSKANGNVIILPFVNEVGAYWCADDDGSEEFANCCYLYSDRECPYISSALKDATCNVRLIKDIK